MSDIEGLEMPLLPKEPCYWVEATGSESYCYVTSCGRAIGYQYPSGTEYKFCPHCGQQIRYVEVKP